MGHGSKDSQELFNCLLTDVPSMWKTVCEGACPLRRFLDNRLTRQAGFGSLFVVLPIAWALLSNFRIKTWFNKFLSVTGLLRLARGAQ
jgi:hypothetical protein